MSEKLENLEKKFEEKILEEKKFREEKDDFLKKIFSLEKELNFFKNEISEKKIEIEKLVEKIDKKNSEIF